MNEDMNITFAQYVQYGGVNDTVLATINGITMSIPIDTNNRHYAEIMRQVEAGELTIADAE